MFSPWLSIRETHVYLTCNSDITPRLVSEGDQAQAYLYVSAVIILFAEFVPRGWPTFMVQTWAKGKKRKSLLFRTFCHCASSAPTMKSLSFMILGNFSPTNFSLLRKEKARHALGETQKKFSWKANSHTADLNIISFKISLSRIICFTSCSHAIIHAPSPLPNAIHTSPLLSSPTTHTTT